MLNCDESSVIFEDVGDNSFFYFIFGSLLRLSVDSIFYVSKQTLKQSF